MFWIRTDGNARIGAGHLMRCLTIADELRRIVGETDKIIFLCGDESSAALVRAHGHEAEALGTDYRNMEGELPAIKAVMDSVRQKTNFTVNGKTQGSDVYKRDVILTDSYFVTDNYLEQIGKLGRTILMDDMQSRAFPADVVVNYNAFADRRIYQELYAGTETELLIGNEYIPIREQFVNRNYTVREKVSDVLITTGGGDADNIAGKILAGLNGCADIEDIRENVRKLRYHLVIGQFNPHYQKLKELSEKFPWIHIHANVQDMASLMMECDLAVTAGGTTVYELAAVGVPMIGFSYAENQEQLTEYLGRERIAGCGGRYHEDAGAVLERIGEVFDGMVDCADIRSMCYLRERKLVDGGGARRLAEKIYKKEAD